MRRRKKTRELDKNRFKSILVLEKLSQAIFLVCNQLYEYFIAENNMKNLPLTYKY